MQVFVGVLIDYLTILLYYSIIFTFLQGDIANITDCFLECRENAKNHRFAMVWVGCVWALSGGMYRANILIDIYL